MHASAVRSSPLVGLIASLACAVMAACAGSDDSAARDSGMASGQAADSTAAGANRSNMPAINRPAVKDADHEFLRMMSDHHEGLVVMMDDAIERATSATAIADAKKLHGEQDAERSAMEAIIRTVYNDSTKPMVMPSARAMTDSLQQKTGAAYDREMYRRVIMHHQEGIRMIDDFLPRLTRANVRQMAEKMRADQQREIAEFQRKQTG